MVVTNSNNPKCSLKMKRLKLYFGLLLFITTIEPLGPFSNLLYRYAYEPFYRYYIKALL